jgi:hypothetical protein
MNTAEEDLRHIMQEPKTGAIIHDMINRGITSKETSIRKGKNPQDKKILQTTSQLIMRLD